MDMKPLEALLQRGVDNAMLRFTLGSHCLKMNDAGTAITHLQRCLQWSPDYSAAWKLLGKAHALAGHPEAAQHAWTQGMAVAERKGDHQARKEMQVFLRRLQRTAQQPAATPVTTS
ncbi:MAG: tetratricopeptide repeat protein [Acidovorax sp.]